MMVVIGNRHTTSRSWELSVVQIKPDHTRATCKTERPAMSGSKGLKRYNGVEQDDEGAYVYYDEHIAALRRAKAEGVREIVRGLKNKRIDFEQKLSVTRSSFMQDEYEANIELLSELITEADARAAQIEEGE